MKLFMNADAFKKAKKGQSRKDAIAEIAAKKIANSDSFASYENSAIAMAVGEALNKFLNYPKNKRSRIAGISLKKAYENIATDGDANEDGLWHINSNVSEIKLGFTIYSDIKSVLNDLNQEKFTGYLADQSAVSWNRLYVSERIVKRINHEAKKYWTRQLKANGFTVKSDDNNSLIISW